MKKSSHRAFLYTLISASFIYFTSTGAMSENWLYGLFLVIVAFLFSIEKGSFEERDPIKIGRYRVSGMECLIALLPLLLHFFGPARLEHWGGKELFFIWIFAVLLSFEVEIREVEDE